MLKVTPKN